MLYTELNINIVKQLLERKLREGNLEYVNGMMYIIANTPNLKRHFQSWIEYVYWANQANTQRAM